ncbi:MAG: DUF4153 domain-containing protein [Hyphomonadaceae bacterium]
MLRWSTRLAAVLIAPLLALATQALYLRVAQYGWSPERIYAAAALLVGALYALSYLVAAFWRPWMKLLELGNVATAFVVIVVLIAVFTPIADPARLSVADQMQRLRSGAVSAEAFDLIFLRFESGRYGRDAFDAIRADRSTPEAQALAARADTVALYSSVYQARFDQRQSARRSATAPELRFEVLPEARRCRPTSWSKPTVVCVTGFGFAAAANASCVARMLDLNGDGVPEVIITGDRRGGYARGEDGVWTWIGGFEAACRGIMDAMRRGEVAAAPTDYADLTFDGLRMPLERPNACDDEASASR